MESEIFLSERVEVVATFSKSGRDICYPRKFRRSSGREVTVTEIGLRHPVTAGRRTLHMFDVTDGEADYRLEFDTERLSWRLVMEADRA